MNIKFSEVAGQLFSIVVICLALYFAKTLLQFIVVLFIIGVICWLIGAMLDDEEPESKVRYFLCDPMNNRVEINKEAFEKLREENDKLLAKNKELKDGED